MKTSALPYWLTFAALVAASYLGFHLYRSQSNPYQAGSSSSGTIDLPPLTDFELTDQNGKPFRSEDMKGKVWVASFFYSNCPNSCARLNANIKYLTTLEDLKDVTWVSITVDPQTDTQEVLSKYAETLRADENRWRFCRHDDFQYVKRLSEDVLHVGGVNYQGHNDYVVVVDRTGTIAGMFNGYDSQSLDKGVALLKKLLSESADQPADGPQPAEAA